MSKKTQEKESILNRAGKRALVREGFTSRQFNYTKQVAGTAQDTSLNFSLRTDVKNELKAFLELLEAAVVDVKEEILK